MSDARAGIRELAAALRALHHKLLLATQQSFEKLHGRVDGPGALLQLAVHDPLFAWLRPLSQELALLDELAAADELEDRDLTRARSEVAALIEGSPEFASAYRVYLQSDPDVVLAHAAVRKILPRVAAER